MKSIAFCVPGLDRIGGAERQLLLLARGLHRRGWKVSVLALTGTGGAAGRELQAAGIGFHSFHMRKGVADPRGWIGLHRWLRREKPDLLHAHLPHATWMARWARLALPGLRIIDTLHSSSTGNLWRHIGYRASNWLACEVTAVSEAVAQSHLAAGLVPPRKLSIIPNGIDTKAFAPDATARLAERRKLGLDDKFLWIASGRLEAVKDYPTLFGALRRLPEKAHLLLAGEGSQRTELQALALRLGLEGRVHFLGFVPDPRSFLQAADAAVLSSLWEGLPLALLEAGASGLPAVSTDVPGSRQVIEEGVNGLLAPAREPLALAAAMRTLMETTSAEREKMGEQARLRIVEQYDLETVLDQWEALYGSLTAGQTSADSEAENHLPSAEASPV